jgi:16S rRNA (uracil1498-N3)-methyltransferase
MAMAAYDFKAIRLFVEGPLAAGTIIACDRDKTNYLVNVMRLADGAKLLVFDGQSGEWAARLERVAKKSVQLVVETLSRPQTASGDLWLLFAPLKHARLDYMVQKAVEMGASRLVPVMTRYTQAARLNPERMRANIIEAAEQCGILAVAECHDPQPLGSALALLAPERLVVFCDEDAALANPAEVLLAHAGERRPLAVLVGPEGGFAPEERDFLAKRPHTLAISLGPRILRADTAAVAALAVVQSTLGDWR